MAGYYMEYTLKSVADTQDWRALHAIRRRVLFAPWRHPYAYDDNHPDDRAPGHVPFLLLLDGDVIGTARLDIKGVIGIVRLVAIATDVQRQGHGRALSALLDMEAKRLGITILRVNAAADAVGYYEKIGWHPAVWDAAELRDLAINCVQMEKAL